MLRDLVYAIRTLRKRPGFTFVAVLSLALGIGANSAIYTLGAGLVLRPMPVPDASGVVVVESQMKGESLAGLFQYSPMSYPDYLDLRRRSQSAAGLTAAQFSQFGFTRDRGAVPESKFGAMVSGDFFRVLGVQPAAGRTFRADEDQVPGRDAVVVLGYELWKTEFAANPDAVGSTVFLNGLPFTVVGVAPDGFNGPMTILRCALYVPIAMAPRLSGEPDILARRASRDTMVHGRLKPGVKLRQAAAETSLIGRQVAEAHPDTNRTCSFVMETDAQSRFHQDPFDFILFAFLLSMAVVVLLIACANLTNLMLSRGRARMREIAVRLAIGAGRARLVRQLLVEGLLIAVLGGAVGLLLAQAASDLFSQIKVPTDIPVVFDFKVDRQVLLFTLIVSAASVLVFGLAPALQTTRPELISAIKSGGAAARNRLWGRNALVVGQVAGSLLLLVVATQAYRGLAILLSSPAGFRTDHVLTASFNPALARYDKAKTEQFYKQLLERARDLPGVEQAALTETVPMVPGGDTQRFAPEGVPLPPGSDAISTFTSAVTEDFFTAMDIPIAEGRAFSERDRADAPRVAIVNQSFARQYYPHSSAVGKRLRLDGPNGAVVEIVGVARQSKYFLLVEPPLSYVYLPLKQRPRSSMTLALHTSVPPGDLAAPLRALVRSIDAGQPVTGVRTMEEIFDMRARKTLNILLSAVGAMGVLGLVLALVGLYGLMTYSVSLRQREIGIRMAIGSDRQGVVRMILGRGLTLAAIGVGVGTLMWLSLSRPAMAVLQVRSFSWGLLGLVAAGLLAAAAAGTYFPARRASLLDPNRVLRQD